jgi:hypothetical protein
LCAGLFAEIVGGEHRTQQIMVESVMTAIEFTDEELDLLRNALRAFMSGFGHDEHALVQRIRALLGKISTPN